MCRGFIQRPTKRVICARLSPVTFTRNRCTIPFCPLLNLRYRCLFSVPSIKPYASPALFRRAVDLPVPLAELLHLPPCPLLPAAARENHARHRWAKSASRTGCTTRPCPPPCRPAWLE